MNKALKSLVAAAGMATLGISASASADNYSHISAPFGTGSYVLGAAFEEIVRNNHDTIRLSHSESPGFVFNLNQLDQDPSLRETMIVGTGRGVLNAARHGDTPFEEPVGTVMALANYIVVTPWLVTLNPDIEDISDLRGRTVALGRRPQINWTVQPEALLRTGWELGDDVDVQYLGLGDAVTALLDGQVDAAVMGGYLPLVDGRMEFSPHTVEFMAANRSNTRFLDWGEEAVQRVIDELGMPLIPTTLPEGAAGDFQEGEMQLSADTVSWGAHESFPEEAAYEIVKLLIDNYDKFADYHALGRLMTPEGMAFGWEPEEFHPGALRAYREAGILD